MSRDGGEVAGGEGGCEARGCDERRAVGDGDVGLGEVWVWAAAGAGGVGVGLGYAVCFGGVWLKGCVGCWIFGYGFFDVGRYADPGEGAELSHPAATHQPG